MGFGQQALVFSLTLSILVTLMMPSNIITSNNAFDTFFYQQGSGDATTITVNNGFFSAVPQQSSSTSTQVGVTLGFADPLTLIFGIIQFLFTVLSAPALLFTSLHLPYEMIILIAVPIAFIQMMGIIGLIRGTFSW